MSKKTDTQSLETQAEPRAKRRVFSIQYRRSIVEKADACTMPGEVGALLRREGIYSSYLTDWRREMQSGNLEGYGRLRRGPVAKELPLPPARDEQQRRIEQLERENHKLRLRAVKAEALVEFQKNRRRTEGCQAKRNPRMQIRGELAAIQMSPRPLIAVIVQSSLRNTRRTLPKSLRRMIHLHIDPQFLDGQLDALHPPRRH